MKIPFIISRAKHPSNPNGLEVVTRDGHKVELQKIVKPVLKYQNIEFPIVGKIGGIPYCWRESGRFGISDKDDGFDLFLEDGK